MTESTPAQRLLTVNEAAAMMGCDRYEIYRLIHSDALHAVRNRPGGKRFRIPEAAVKDYLAGGYTGPAVAVPDKNTMLDVGDVARRLDCSRETVRRLVNTGELAAIRFTGRTSRMRIQPEAVEDYLRRHLVAPPPDEKTA